MSWPVTIGVIVGFVTGANLGILLMVALRAGRRHDDADDNAALIVRIQELESALARQANPSAPGIGLVGRSQPEPRADERSEDARLHGSPRAS